MTALAKSASASSSSGRFTYPASTPAAGFLKFSVTVGSTPASARPSKEVEKAVYAYVQAVRALGRTEVTVSDVSAALHIEEPAVIRALTALRRKGVKFA